MSTRRRSVRFSANRSTRGQFDSISYKSIVNRLLSEMAALVRPAETRSFRGPFKLLILSNQGRAVFSGEIGCDGRICSFSPVSRIRRSHFPANVVITDGANAVRTFRIVRWS
jgi:hypothetical protein